MIAAARRHTRLRAKGTVERRDEPPYRSRHFPAVVAAVVRLFSQSTREQGSPVKSSTLSLRRSGTAVVLPRKRREVADTKSETSLTISRPRTARAHSRLFLGKPVPLNFHGRMATFVVRQQRLMKVETRQKVGSSQQQAQLYVFGSRR